MVPRLFASVREVLDPFAYSTIAIGQLSVEQGHVLIHPFESLAGTLQGNASFLSERAAVTSFLVIFSEITGVYVADLRFVPITGVIFTVLSYAVAKQFTHSRYVGAIFALCMAYDPFFGGETNSIFYIGIGFAYFYLFLLLYMKSEESHVFARKGVALMAITFIATYLTYYSVEVDIIVFCLAAWLIIVLASRALKIEFGRTQPIGLRDLAFFFIVVFLSLDTIFYAYVGAYTASVAGSSGFLLSYMNFVRGLLLGEPTAVSAYDFEVFTSRVGLLLLLSISVPVAIYVTSRFSVLFGNLFAGKRTFTDVRHVAYLAMIAVIVFSFAIYVPLGLFQYHHIWLVLPLLAFFSIERFAAMKPTRKRHLIRTFLLCCILVLCVTKSAAWYQDKLAGYGQQSDSWITPACVFLGTFVVQGNVLTDMYAGGRLLTEVTQTNRASTVNVYPLSKTNVDFLYVPDSDAAAELFHRNNFGYLVLSYKSISGATFGMGWVSSRPLGEAFQYPVGYPSFDRVYDDSHAVVYRYVGS